jgi:hypothetical protein
MATALAIASLVAVALMTSSPVGATGAQRMPVTCYAQFLAGMPNLQTLDVRIVTPQWPAFWDTVLPSGALTGASGNAVLTPSGQFNANCNVPSGILLSVDGTTSWPTGSYTIPVDCWTVMADNPMGFFAKEYRGHGTLRVDTSGEPIGGGSGATIGNATITCNATYSSTEPGPPA